jgi:hypothetical protein
MRTGGDRSSPEQFTAMLLDQSAKTPSMRSPPLRRISRTARAGRRGSIAALDSSDHSLIAVISAPARSTFLAQQTAQFFQSSEPGEARFGGTELAREIPQCHCFAL